MACKYFMWNAFFWGGGLVIYAYLVYNAFTDVPDKSLTLGSTWFKTLSKLFKIL